MRILVDESIKGDPRTLEALVHEGFAQVRTTGVEVWVQRGTRPRDSFTGLAYWHPAFRSQHPSTRYLVRLRVPATLRNRAYPKTYRYPGLKTAPWITVRDWRERFLALVAHEACHIRQFLAGLRRSEVEAERWAEEVLMRWRRERGVESTRERGALTELDLRIEHAADGRI